MSIRNRRRITSDSSASRRYSLEPFERPQSGCQAIIRRYSYSYSQRQMPAAHPESGA